MHTQDEDKQELGRGLSALGCSTALGLALDDLLAHADEAPGTCAEPFETAPGCGLPPSLRAVSGVSGARKPFSGCYVKKPVDALFRVGNPYLRAI